MLFWASIKTILCIKFYGFSTQRIWIFAFHQFFFDHFSFSIFDLFFFFFIVAWFYYWFPFPNNFSSSSLLLFKLLTITRKNSISSLLLNGIFNIKNKLYFAFFFHQSISWSHACNIFTKWKKKSLFFFTFNMTKSSIKQYIHFSSYSFNLYSSIIYYISILKYIEKINRYAL